MSDKKSIIVKPINRKTFETAVKPLIDYLKANHHPHVKVIVDSQHAEIVEGLMSYNVPYDEIEAEGSPV